MARKNGSALLVALVFLTVVTMLAVPAMATLAQWRADYQRLLKLEQAQFELRYQRWADEQLESPPADE